MFHFRTPAPDFRSRSESTHVGRVAPGISNTRNLIAEVGKALRFPRYFGKNFDAFWDCIRDVDIAEYTMILVHDDLPPIPAEDRETYVELLRDAVLYWEKHPEEHSLEVWFPEPCRDEVRSLLEKAPPPEYIE